MVFFLPAEHFILYQQCMAWWKIITSLVTSGWRTVLFGAINAIQNGNRKEIYTLVRDLTDPSLYKVTFMHNGREPKNMKEWAELRGYDISKEPSDEFIYQDVTRLVA